MMYTADLHRLRQMLSFIRTSAEDAGFDEAEINKIELAAEEALVNIIYYAYPGHPEGKIEISCTSPTSRTLEIEFVDQGPPFNPLQMGNQVDPHAALEEREVGGLGVYLMRKLMDECTYLREGEKNVLRITKRG